MHLTTNYDEQISLQGAYLLYVGRSGDVNYVSSHKVNIDAAGVPVIGAGRALQVAALKTMLHQMARAQGVSDLVWTDEHTVAASATLQVWWTPAQPRWMHFDAPGLQMSLPANNPPLVWLANGHNLYVYALKDDQKPGPETALHHAPLFNVYATGNVCQGSMRKPKDGKAKAWVEAFYAATGTHANPSNRRLTSYPKGDKALWKFLMTSKKKPAFPTDKLLPFGKTLGEVVQQLDRAE